MYKKYKIKNILLIIALISMITLTIFNVNNNYFRELKSISEYSNSQKLNIPDSIVTFDFINKNKFRIIGIIRQNDCLSCYELLISELNNLSQSETLKKQIILNVIASPKSANTFHDMLYRRYNPKFEVEFKKANISNKGDFINILPTPCLIIKNIDGTLLYLLQIKISRSRYIYNFFDKIKKINQTL